MFYIICNGLVLLCMLSGLIQLGLQIYRVRNMVGVNTLLYALKKMSTYNVSRDLIFIRYISLM